MLPSVVFHYKCINQFHVIGVVFVAILNASRDFINFAILIPGICINHAHFHLHSIVSLDTYAGVTLSQFQYHRITKPVSETLIQFKFLQFLTTASINPFPFLKLRGKRKLHFTCRARCHLGNKYFKEIVQYRWFK